MKSPRAFLHWRLLLLTTVCAAGFHLCAAGADEKNDIHFADLAGVAKGISVGETFSTSFPTAMVASEEIDVDTKEGPIRFEPAVTGTFTWKSQTEVEFVPDKVKPGTKFKVIVVDGLKDLDGKPVVQKGVLELATLESNPFTVDCDFSALKVDRRPAVPLRFSLKVKPANIAESVWFQDRDSRKRYPAEVVLEADSEETVDSATVTPREDLPGGRTFDLVIEGLKDSATETPLPGVKVFSLGVTEILKVEKVAAFNYAMRKKRIAVEFNEPMDPAEGRKIKIEPAVPGVQCRAIENSLWFEGDFDLSQHYTVTIPADVKGTRGFALAGESKWGATFHAKKPAIIFPTEDIHLRAKPGLNFTFIEANTGPLEWRLARVPPEKLLAIYHRIREFTEQRMNPVTNEPEEDAETGFPIWNKTEFLIDASNLEVVGRGNVVAPPAEQDTRCDIKWKPDHDLPAGTYVLEISGKNAEGKTIGNRALITFTEFAAAQKQFGNTRLVHLVDLSDGRPVPGVRIRAVTKTNAFIAEAKTDKNGTATFSKDTLFPGQSEKGADAYLIDTPGGPMLQQVNAASYSASGYSGGSDVVPAPPPGEDMTGSGDIRIAVAVDRPICRPGQTVKFKAFVRELGKDGELHVPKEKNVSWAIVDDGQESFLEGTDKLDDYGGMEGEWKIPATVKLGGFHVKITVKGAEGSKNFEVQEFRPPPFTVELEDLKLPGAQTGVRIKSAYFHGAPNEGAKVKWSATWTARTSGDDSVVVTDKPRPASGQSKRELEVKGEGTLGPDGTLELKHGPPFKDGVLYGWYDVRWDVYVTGLDGQTVNEFDFFNVYSVPVELMVTAKQVPKENFKAKAESLAVHINATATAPDKSPANGTPVSVELYQMITKTTKEQISPNVFRYVNAISYEKCATETGSAPFEKDIPVSVPGVYLAAVRDPQNSAVPVFTARAFVAGLGDAEFPVRDEESLGVTSDKGDADTEGNFYDVGGKAVISVQSPFAGTAWVTVEADSVIDTFIIPFESNSASFELPIKKEYAPNAWVSVHLLKGGGEAGLPAERFGAVKITVRRPDLRLDVKPVFASKEVRPRDKISGEVTVMCEGRPVENADLTVYADDESVLNAGGWVEPPLRGTMYPTRSWGVATYQGLDPLSTGVDESSLHQKGFIIGAADMKGPPVGEMMPAECRTNFPPLAYWKTHIRTDKNGKAPFEFNAPDGLTKYRVIALAQTKTSQFGTGSDFVEVSKQVQIEPALPRFVRVGDELELRALVRQKIADELPVTVKCVTGLQLLDADAQAQKVKKGEVSVFRFRAKVGEIASASVRFETSAGPGDSVQITFPVHPPTLLREESVFAPLGEVQKQIPDDWMKATGTAEVTVSTSPWLPKLTALPLILEYPHGCFEQISSRVLGYTVLDDLLQYLPEPADREKTYGERIDAGIASMGANLVDQNYLPYWPYGKASAFPTVAGYWSVRKAAEKGLKIPAGLEKDLEQGVVSIASGKDDDLDTTTFDHTFALMVLSEKGDAKTLEPQVRELYSRREKAGEDERAMLALAMHNLKIMPKEQAQLLAEIDRPLEEKAFDPDTFGSTTRTEAIRAYAFAVIQPASRGKAMEGFAKRVDELLDSAQSLSTQENFWLLMAFKALHAHAAGAPVDFKKAAQAPAAISRNGASALWNEPDIKHVRDFALRMDKTDGLNCLVSAVYRSDSPVTNRTDRGFRIERVVKDINDPKRNGSAEAPFHLGDEIVITYRVISPKLQHYVALEDELPAALEAINPWDLKDADTLPPQAFSDKTARLLELSYPELRDHETCLYFNRVESGVSIYTVQTRATCAGVFHWPATQVVPMYDSRFSGLTPSSICHVVGD